MRTLLACSLLLLAPVLSGRGVSSGASPFAATSEVVFFTTFSGPLWRTDGTAEGTWPIGPSNVNPLSREAVVIGEQLYFLSQKSYLDSRHLMVTDGSRRDARLLNTFTGIDVWGLSANDKRLFYFTQSSNMTDCVRLSVGDGTPEKTRVIAALLTDETGALASAGRRMLFSIYPAQPFQWGGRTNYDVWSTDGTTGGTGPLFGEVPKRMHRLGDILLLDDLHLYRTDGTLAGTYLLLSDARVIGTSGNAAYVSSKGALWKTDGTIPGTTHIAALPFEPITAGTAGDRVVALSHDQLWTLEPNGGWRVLAQHSAGGGRRRAAQAAGLFFFGTADKIWRTDGTESGTFIVASTTGFGSLFALGNRVIWSGDDGIHGTELWASDGTIEGTGMIVNLAEEGTIRGRVTDRATGRPLSGVTVELREAHCNWRCGVEVQTDGDGQYLLEGIESSAMIDVRPADGHISRTTTVQFAPGQTLDLDFALPLTGRIAGRVTRADGTPVPHATVYFASSLIDAKPHTGASTDADGRYVTGPLDPDLQLVAYTTFVGHSRSAFDGVVCAAGCDADTPVTLISAPEAGTRDDVNFTIYPVPKLRGRILDHITGQPVSFSVAVQAWRDGSYRTQVLSKLDGTYEMTLPEGKHFIRVFTSAANFYIHTWYPDSPCNNCNPPHGVAVVPKPGEVIEHDFRIRKREPSY